MSQKKPSLFKQRIKETKVESKQGFPQVFKIAIEKNEPPPKPIIDSMKQKHIIEQQQYDEISKQNNDFISKLSPQEIEKMQKQLRQQLPQDFMQKLRRAMDDTKLPNQPHEIPLPTEQPEPKNKHTPNTYKNTICQQMNRLSIDLIVKQIFLRQEHQTQAISLSLILAMIDSQNNQSYVTGLKTLTQFLQALQKFTFIYGITIIDQHYFSRVVLLDHIYKSILQVAITKEDLKVFKTCNVQLLQTLLKFKTVGGYLHEDAYRSIVREAESIESVDLKEEVQESAKQHSNVSLWTKLLSVGKLETLQQLMLIVNSPAVLLEKLSIQYCYFGNSIGQVSEMVHYYDDLLSRFLTYPHDHLKECQNALQLAYRVFETCAISSEIEEFPSDLPQYLAGKLGRFLIRMLNKSQKTVETYKILFILSRFSFKLFNQLCQNMKKHPQCLCFINLQLYLNIPWSQDDTVMVNETLKMIQSWQADIHYELILLQLLKIFECSCENYQQLQMDGVFRKVIFCCRADVLKKVISLSTVKSLVRYYNSNSFGNIVFSKVMVFLGSCIFDEAIQLHIVNECFERYPFIFYQSGKEKMYTIEEEEIYDRKGRTSMVGQELEAVKKMLSEKMEQVMHNDFLKQL